MSIQLEEGKYYRTRTGDRRGPARYDPYDEDYPWDLDDGKCRCIGYTRSGAWLKGTTGLPQDLVAEWPDEPEVPHDPVEHPKHYTGHPSGVECIAITEHMNFCLGNAVKYIWRAGEKGDALIDLKKARWYIDREIERLSKKA